MRKIYDSTFQGVNIIVEFHEDKTNPYRIYRKWYDGGWHRKLLEKYNCFGSCLIFIMDYYREHTDTFI